MLKLNIDGDDAQYTAAMLTPYSDKPVTSRDTLPPVDNFAAIVRRDDREGIDIHIDSYGDSARACRAAFVAVAAKRGPIRLAGEQPSQSGLLHAGSRGGASAGRRPVPTRFPRQVKVGNRPSAKSGGWRRDQL